MSDRVDAVEIMNRFTEFNPLAGETPLSLPIPGFWFRKICALADRIAKAENQNDDLSAEIALLTAKLQSAKSEVDEILRAALSGDCDRYLNYDLQGNKYCKWGVVSKDIAAVFDVTEPSDIDVSKQGFND